MKREYEEPTLHDVGSLTELTLAPTSNKKHAKADLYTAATNGAIVGSLYPVS